MDWENILILILGGAIGIVTNYLTNRYQLVRWREEREEQRREAKIQEKKKWIERDILKIMDSLERMFILRSESTHLIYLSDFLEIDKERGLLNDDEYLAEIQVNAKRYRDNYLDIHKALEVISIQVYSFGDEIQSDYNNLVKEMVEYFKLVKDNFDATEENNEKWGIVKSMAGQLHKALREKLISLREEET